MENKIFFWLNIQTFKHNKILNLQILHLIRAILDK